VSILKKEEIVKRTFRAFGIRVLGIVAAVASLMTTHNALALGAAA